MTLSLQLDSILIEKTYGDWLEGLPGPSAVLENAKHRAEVIFGTTRPIYVAPYEVIKRQGKRPWDQLPQWRHLINVTGPAQSEEGFEAADGAHLILIGFADTIKIDWEIDSEVWRKYARNFSF